VRKGLPTSSRYVARLRVRFDSSPLLSQLDGTDLVSVVDRTSSAKAARLGYHLGMEMHTRHADRIGRERAVRWVRILTEKSYLWASKPFIIMGLDQRNMKRCRQKANLFW
jgi:hypothetical protein